MIKRHHIVLITGLGSSLPLIGLFWTAWARRLQKRLQHHYSGRKDLTIHRVSSDGRGEFKALRAIQSDQAKGRLGKVAIVGHSNGFRDGLNMAAALYPWPVEYFGGIDMTLGEFGAVATNNIKTFHEFHAILQKADFAKDFDKSKHTMWKIKKGHTAAASDPFVQTKIFKSITSVI